MNDNITLTEQPNGQYKFVQLTFAEDRYCEQRALGKKRRESYRFAFPDESQAPEKTIDTAASRLEERPEIQARITEWILDKTEDEKIQFRADRQWAIKQCRDQLKVIALDPKLFATAGIKVLEFLGKLEGWFTERLEITANASGRGEAVYSEDNNRRFQLLIEKVRLAHATKDEHDASGV